MNGSKLCWLLGSSSIPVVPPPVLEQHYRHVHCNTTSSLMLDAVTGMPAAAFLDLISLSLILSSGSGISNELMARRTFLGAGRGAGVPSHGGLCIDLVI